MNTTENQNDIYAHLRLEYLRSLCGGYEPHCAGWTRQMLPDGYRPLAKGEVIQNGVDEIYYEFATPKWHKCSSPEGTSAMPTMQHRRTKRPIEYHIAPDPAPTYHTPNVVQQRREEAAAINTAMNPAPAGKLSDKELGVIGAKEASNWLKERAHTFSMVVNDSSAWWGQDAPARTAFARAVREAVEKEQTEEIARLTAIIEQAIEMVNTPGTTKDNLPQAINAKIMQRDEFHDATLKRLDVAKAEISRLKTEYESLLKVYKNADEGARNMHSELKRLQSASRMCTADMDALKDQLAKANAELERLRWRSVEVKPTREDGDRDGKVTVIHKDGVMYEWHWNMAFHENHRAWRPFCPPPALSAEEVERERFEKAYREEWERCEGQDSKWKFDPRVFTRDDQGRYIAQGVEPSWRMWKLARAAKEGEK